MLNFENYTSSEFIQWILKEVFDFSFFHISKYLPRTLTIEPLITSSSEPHWKTLTEVQASEP